MISKDKMSVTVGVAFVWFTTQFGGGFASGNQLRQYFFTVRNLGIRNLHYDSISGCIFPVGMPLRYAKKLEVYDYRSFNNSFYGKVCADFFQSV